MKLFYLGSNIPFNLTFRYNMDKTKLLSLTLSQDIGDNTKDDDAEVSSITGCSVTPHLTTRHITPQMFSDSAATSSWLPLLARISPSKPSVGGGKNINMCSHKDIYNALILLLLHVIVHTIISDSTLYKSISYNFVLFVLIFCK